MCTFWNSLSKLKFLEITSYFCGKSDDNSSEQQMELLLYGCSKKYTF